MTFHVLCMYGCSFRMFSNEDVTIGSWMLAMNVNHENNYELCAPDCTASSVAVWDIPKCSGLCFGAMLSPLGNWFVEKISSEWFILCKNMDFFFHISWRCYMKRCSVDVRTNDWFSNFVAIKDNQKKKKKSKSKNRLYKFCWPSCNGTF